jgi:hypothetical protein
MDNFRRKLQSVGIETFIKYFNVFKENKNEISNELIYEAFNANSEEWAKSSYCSKASGGKKMFRLEMEIEALVYIANQATHVVDSHTKKRAAELLKEEIRLTESLLEEKNEEQPLSIEELEAKALRLSSDIKKRKCAMEWENPVREALLERKRQLDDAFVFTPENIEKFLSLNKQIMDCQEKLREEGIKLVQELEKRIAGDDNFLHDYEIEAVIKPMILVQDEDGEWEEPDGIYELLQSDINPVEIRFDPRYCDSKWIHFGKTEIHFSTGSSWNHWFAFDGKSGEHYICYGMHKLYDDSLYSYSDILKINDLWADIKMELQHY